MSSRPRQAKRLGSTVKAGSESSKRSKSSRSDGVGCNGASSSMKTSRDWGFNK